MGVSAEVVLLAIEEVVIDVSVDISVVRPDDVISKGVDVVIGVVVVSDKEGVVVVSVPCVDAVAEGVSSVVAAEKVVVVVSIAGVGVGVAVTGEDVDSLLSTVVVSNVDISVVCAVTGVVATVEVSPGVVYTEKLAVGVSDVVSVVVDLSVSVDSDGASV